MEYPTYPTSVLARVAFIGQARGRRRRAQMLQMVALYRSSEVRVTARKGDPAALRRCMKQRSHRPLLSYLLIYGRPLFLRDKFWYSLDGVTLVEDVKSTPNDGDSV